MLARRIARDADAATGAVPRATEPLDRMPVEAGPFLLEPYGCAVLHSD